MSAEMSPTFGQEVKRLREQCGISQSDLARGVSCSVDTIRKIENNPGYRTSEALAEKLADKLGITGAEEVAAFIAFARNTASKHSVVRPIEDKADHVADEIMNVSDGIALEETIVSAPILDDDSFSQEHAATEPANQLETSPNAARWNRNLLVVVAIMLITVVSLWNRKSLVTVTIVLIIALSLLVFWWRSYSATTYLQGPVPLVSPVNSGILNPALAWQQGISLDSSYALNRDTESLSITAGGHTNFTRGIYTAPLITLPIQGDFTAQVMIVFQPGSSCCKHAGMGARAVDDNRSWIRISRDHADTIQLDGLLGERSTNSSASNYTQDRVWFKIERRDDRFTLSYSSNNVDWIALRKDYTFAMSENAQLFLFVYSAHSDAIVSAEFSNLIVE